MGDRLIEWLNSPLSEAGCAFLLAWVALCVVATVIVASLVF